MEGWPLTDKSIAWVNPTLCNYEDNIQGLKFLEWIILSSHWSADHFYHMDYKNYNAQKSKKKNVTYTIPQV